MKDNKLLIAQELKFEKIRIPFVFKFVGSTLTICLTIFKGEKLVPYGTEK